jgi:hypothetical protein
MTKKTTTEQLNHVEASLRRWHTRLKIASNKIEKLVKRRRSLMLKLAGLPETKRHDLKEQVATLGADSLLPDFVARGQAAQKVVDDLVIPPELRRVEEATKPGKPGPKLLSDMINKPFIDARKRKRLEEMEEKRRGRSMFAKSDMPLTGKDALKAIRGKK